jgi:hypothetical protein
MEDIMKTTLIIATALGFGAIALSASALDVSHARQLAIGLAPMGAASPCGGPAAAPILAQPPCGGAAPVSGAPVGCAGAAPANVATSLGTLTFTPLGVDGNFCNYLANWTSPFNPNDVQICIVQEARTPFAPSCILNERADIVTLVQSSTTCSGFNLKGEAFDNVSLLFSESSCGLNGIAVIPSGGVPQTYPVSSL